MFKFLKDKLREAISSVTKKVEKDIEKEESKLQQSESEKPELIKEELFQEVKEGVLISKNKEESKKIDLEKEDLPKSEKKEIIQELINDIQKDKKEKLSQKKKKEIAQEQPKKSFFKRLQEKVTLTTINHEKFNELFYDIELALLENNVAQEVIDRIKIELEKNLVDRPIKRNEISNLISSSLKEALETILDAEKIDLNKLIKGHSKKPFVILILGYNGVGKSLTIAKLGNFLKNNHKVLIAAGDTFRAAGSSQLVEYSKQINVNVIKGNLGSDSCSIIYDTIISAKSKNYDVVLADTAGRIHNDKDLVNELKKIVRVNKPDLNILVIDAMTGSDVVQQVEEFNKAVKVDALIITKVDTYEKGGTLLSAAYLLKKPILFLGTGQAFADLKEFNKEELIKNLGL